MASNVRNRKISKNHEPDQVPNDTNGQKKKTLLSKIKDVASLLIISVVVIVYVHINNQYSPKPKISTQNSLCRTMNSN